MRYHVMRTGERVVLELAINHSLFLQGNETNLLDTMLHEMTHVEAWLVHGDRGHGAAWKRVARRVGCEPRACSARIIRRRRRNSPPLTRVPDWSWLPQIPQQVVA
jgi:predicted SprT family Zn-dependent metalloprotease